MSKHTPGPWEVSRAFGDEVRPRFIKHGHDHIAQTICLDGDDGLIEMRANARLIAAAPELLEACQVASELIHLARKYFPKSMQNGDRFTLENTNATIVAAIAKAEGV